MAAESTQSEGHRARVELCQWASVNVDGTHTIIRGGLEHWTALLPLDLLIWAFLELPPTTPKGMHDFQVDILNPDGARVAGAAGRLSIGAESRTIFTLPLQWSVQVYGRWRVRFAVGEIQGEAGLDIRNPTTA